MKIISALHRLRIVKGTVFPRLNLAFLSLLAAAAVGSGMAIGNSKLISRADAAVSSAYVPDVQELLNLRSPGGRANGWLLGTKSETNSSTMPEATERVLPSVRRRLPSSLGGMPAGNSLSDADGFPGADAILATDGLFAEPSLPDLSGPGVGSGSFSTAPAGGGITGAVGGSSAPNTVAPGPAVEETVVVAVPELTTWGMMILGFGMLGVTMRRSRSLYVVLNCR